MWRKIQEGDVDTLAEIAKFARDKQTIETFNEHIEKEHLIYVFENSDGPIGYAIAYPSIRLEQPAPDTLRDWKPPKMPNSFFIESITLMETMDEDISPEEDFIHEISEIAREQNINHLSMVCAPGTEEYWQDRFLFGHEDDVMMDIWVQSGGYPDGSKYLQRRI